MRSREERYEFRRLRVKSSTRGTPERPRLTVYRSLKYIYAQIVDDVAGRTLAAASSRDKGVSKDTGVKAASAVGQALAKKAVQKGIQSVIFDRGARPYHGQVKALADGAREAGLKF